MTPWPAGRLRTRARNGGHSGLARAAQARPNLTRSVPAAISTLHELPEEAPHQANTSCENCGGRVPGRDMLAILNSGLSPSFLPSFKDMHRSSGGGGAGWGRPACFPPPRPLTDPRRAPGVRTSRRRPDGGWAGGGRVCPGSGGRNGRSRRRSRRNGVKAREAREVTVSQMTSKR